jgi:hypothetical protein
VPLPRWHRQPSPWLRENVDGDQSTKPLASRSEREALDFRWLLVAGTTLAPTPCSGYALPRRGSSPDTPCLPTVASWCRKGVLSAYPQCCKAVADDCPLMAYSVEKLGLSVTD